MKKLCYKRQTEIADACLDCDEILECFPMENDEIACKNLETETHV